MPRIERGPDHEGCKDHSEATSRIIQTSGNAAVYGSLTGKSVKINGNGGFHYDEALGDIGEFVTESSSTTYTTTGYSRYSWHEIAF